MFEPIRLTVVALRVLTRLPLPEVAVREDDLRRATPAFPLVGLVVAAVAVAARALLDPLLGPTSASVVAVATAVLVTGALQEDGLAAVFDGFFGGRDRSGRLTIMRDARVGTFGAAALVLALLLRVSLLASVDVAAAARALVVGHVLGRASTLLLVRWVSPATPGSSGGALDPVARGPALIGAVLTLAPVVAVTGRLTLLPVAVTVLVTAICGWFAHRKVGGTTADVLGATNQLVHVATMASVVALARTDLLV